jgi:hypothetical protein
MNDVRGTFLSKPLTASWSSKRQESVVRAWPHHVDRVRRCRSTNHPLHPRPEHQARRCAGVQPFLRFV